MTIELPEIGLWAQWLPNGRILHAGWWCDYDPDTLGGIEGVQDVTTQSIDGSNVQRLTNTPDVYETEVEASPSGDIAVFVPREPYRSLELVDLNSGAIETVVQGPHDNLEPIYIHGWSSDGRYLQFSFGAAHGLCD
jgi:Tol biopolymer transport system component